MHPINFLVSAMSLFSCCLPQVSAGGSSSSITTTEPNFSNIVQLELPKNNSFISGTSQISFKQIRDYYRVNPVPFISRKGSKLYEGETEFRFVSMNIPNLGFLEDKPGMKGHYLYPTPLEQEDAIKGIAGMNGRAARMFVFGVGPNQYVTGLRQYNEAAFKVLDHAIAIAGRYNIRLIIPFLNHGFNRNERFGSFANWAAFRNLPGTAFYTNQLLRDDFKHFISFVLNRRNTVNKKLYKDDPAILCWQLGNELGSWTEAVPPSAWIIEMATHMKTVDPNHLVMDGTLAGHDQKRWSVDALKSNVVDIFYNNYYWGQGDIDSGRITSQWNYVKGFNKAFVICEYGLANPSVYESIMKLTISTGMSGSLIWSLRYHSEDGGFYVHNEDRGYKSYHVPGFDLNPSFNIAEEKATIELLRRYSYQVTTGVAKPPLLPIPDAPILKVTPTKSIVWFGSAWAATYQFYKRPAGTNGTYSRVGNQVSDAFESGTVSWKDTTAKAGQSFDYVAKAFNVNAGSFLSKRVTIKY